MIRQFSLNAWNNNKKPPKTSQSLQGGSVCVSQHTFNTQPSSVQFTLAFTFYLCRACRSVTDESLGPSQILSELELILRMHTDFLIPWNMWELFKALIPQSISSSSLSSQFLWLVCCLPQLLSIDSCSSN